MAEKAYLAIKPKNKSIEKQSWMTTYAFGKKEDAQAFLDELLKNEDWKAISQSRIYFGEEEEKLKALAYVGSGEIVGEKWTKKKDFTKIILANNPVAERAEDFHTKEVMDQMQEEARLNMEKQTGKKRPQKKSGVFVYARTYGQDPTPPNIKLAAILNHYYKKGVSAVKMTFSDGRETVVILKNFWYIKTNRGLIGGKRLEYEDIKDLTFKNIWDEAKKLGAQGEVLTGLSEMATRMKATQLETYYDMVCFPKFGSLYAEVVSKDPVTIQYQYKAGQTDVMMNLNDLVSIQPVSMRLEVTQKALIDTLEMRQDKPE